ncbi:MAG: type II secretion system protein N, partial [Pseudomonadota bacterium]|nr:type II secretion system protein N [Pseudomonadota bacterium]
SSGNNQEIVVSSQPRKTGAQQVNMQKIIDAHLFGRLPVKNKPQMKQVVAPKTKLKLTLTGLFEDPKDEKGRAIIDVAGGKTIVVKVGDQIAKTGARLHDIEGDHVLIERNGNLERLPMVRKQMQGMSALLASARSVPVQDEPPAQDESSLPQPRDEVYELPEPEPVPEEAESMDDEGHGDELDPGTRNPDMQNSPPEEETEGSEIMPEPASPPPDDH